ncbi:nucleoside/nucleotide kinase family protein [Subtercola boreus]|uniref:Nucleoside/nucleotide kinase family protein n=1 Tax=Subtercola boreus TaxID=120213 RepID=A0A3E0VE28_9MICO|nr:nucleoside/nucleotide kinase family protein [Subtercola boreus]RFA07728.1 nucleoside/nucleotide kinase family protein [Subtercola boreus]
MHAFTPTRETQTADTPLVLDVAGLVERARALIVPGERHILGLTGAPGAGKSTVAAALLDALGADAVIVGMDGFHLSNEELARLGRADRKGAVDTFDSHGYAALLERLGTATETVYAPFFNRGIEESIGSAVPVDPATPLIITEGNYLLSDDAGWPRARRAIDQVWYLEVPRAERQRRLVLRHESFGRTLAEAESWVENVDLKNGTLIEAAKGRADLVVELAAPADAAAPTTTSISPKEQGMPS